MAYRLPANLHRNRYGTLYFRLSIPHDLRSTFGRSELYRSLGTASVREAADTAQRLRIAFRAVFTKLRTIPMSEKKITASDFLEQFLALPDLRWRIKYAGAELAREEERLQAEIEREQAEIERDQAENKLGLAEARHAEGMANEKRQHDDAMGRVLRAIGAVSAAPEPAPVVASGPTITEVWESYKAEKIATKSWRDGEHSAQTLHWPYVRDMIEVIGDEPISTVTANDVNRYQVHVLKHPDFGGARTRMQRLTRAGAVFKWAKRKRIISDDFRELFQYPGEIENNNYLAFDHADLKALFESTEYREGKFRHPSEYWLPMLGLHTGARLNELCQLTVTDVGKTDGIPTIAILDEDIDKRLKTTASRRIVPIHSNLIACGFLEYVASVKEGRIFPELREDPKMRGSFQRQPSRRFIDYRRQQGVGALTGHSNKTFHSFRSTLISTLRKAGVPGDRRRWLAGHEAADVHDRNYNGGDPLTMFDYAVLKADIEKAQFGVEFTPYRS